MEVTNRMISDQLLLMGDILEILDDNPYKIRAYRRAADIVARHPKPLANLTAEEAGTPEGIGKAIVLKVREVAETGTFGELEDARSKVPPGLLELLALEGIGPKTIKTLWHRMNITGVDDLEKAARGHRIRAIKGFGEKKEALFLKSIARHRQSATRMTLVQAENVIGVVKSVLKDGSYSVAGSYRRRESTIGDIDIVTIADPDQVNRKVRDIAGEMIDAGEKKTSFRCMGSRVDIRFTRQSRCGSMLLYLTGSKEFNIRMRELALRKGLKLNEYGIEDMKEGRLHEFSREEEIFSFLSMDYIVPELREDRGEIEAALSHNLPNLVTRSSLRCDLHVHSAWSDGRLGIGDLAREGERLGYSYLLCTDHSSSLGIARGLDEHALKAQAHEIEVVNRDSPCRVLHGVEVDILADGSPGLPARALADLDLVVGSVHSALSQDPDIMTRRVISAVENEHIDIIGHPTGRLLGQREAYAIDMDRVMEAAASTGTALECNASPYRMDLDDFFIREAIKMGVRISIGTDAHDAADLGSIRYGLGICRRGWATPGDILNTFTEAELRVWAS